MASTRKPRTGKRFAAKGCSEHLRLLTCQGPDSPMDPEPDTKRRNCGVEGLSSGVQQHRAKGTKFLSGRPLNSFDGNSDCHSGDSQPSPYLSPNEGASFDGPTKASESKIKKHQDDNFEALLTSMRASNTLPSDSTLATACSSLDETAVDGLIAVLQSYKDGLGGKGAAAPANARTCGEEEMVSGGPEVINEGTAAQQLLLLASAAKEEAEAHEAHLEDRPVSGNSVSGIPAFSCDRKEDVGVMMEMDVDGEAAADNSCVAVSAKDNSLSLGKLDIKSQTSGETRPNVKKSSSATSLAGKQSSVKQYPDFVSLEGQTFAVLPSKPIQSGANTEWEGAKQKSEFPAVDSRSADARLETRLESDQVPNTKLAAGCKRTIYYGTPISEGLIRTTSVSGQSVSTMLNKQYIGSTNSLKPLTASPMVQGDLQPSTPKGDVRFLESLLSPRWSMNSWTPVRHGLPAQLRESSVWARAKPKPKKICAFLTLEKTAYIVRDILQQLDGQTCHTPGSDVSKIGSCDVKRGSQPPTPMSALAFPKENATPKILESLATLFTQLDGQDGDSAARYRTSEAINLQNRMADFETSTLPGLANPPLPVHSALMAALSNILRLNSHVPISNGWGDVQQMTERHVNHSEVGMVDASKASIPAILEILQKMLASPGTQNLPSFYSAPSVDNIAGGDQASANNGTQGGALAFAAALNAFQQSRLNFADDRGSESVNHPAAGLTINGALAAMLQSPPLSQLLNQASNY